MKQANLTHPTRTVIQLLSLVIACTFSVQVLAQWQWIDKDGRKVYSDRAPPIEIPAKDILKQPSSKGVPAAKAIATPNANAAPVAAAGTAPTTSDGSANAPKISSTDKELEVRKNQAAEAEAAKKKAEEEKLLKAAIENCARAKQAKTALESGVRIATTNAKGERQFMDDAARAAEMQRTQAVINADCK